MLEYRIPIAQVVSGTITAVCFLTALIVVNLRPAGRPRTFGLLGVLLVFASTMLQALNASLAGAYGTDTPLHAALSIAVASLAAGGLVLLALAVSRAGRSRRTRGGH